MAKERDAVLAKQMAEGGPTPRPSPAEAMLAAFLEDLESLAFEGEHGERLVNIVDAAALLRQMASEPLVTGDTGVWPHTPSRRPSTALRLRMPMDLPVFGELRRPKAQVDPANPKGYILELDAFAWGRTFLMRMEGDDFTVFVKDKMATRKLYKGSRNDAGDMRQGANGR